jgi:hypothetical protein
MAPLLPLAKSELMITRRQGFACHGLDMNGDSECLPDDSKYQVESMNQNRSQYLANSLSPFMVIPLRVLLLYTVVFTTGGCRCDNLDGDIRAFCTTLERFMS